MRNDEVFYFVAGLNDDSPLLEKVRNEHFLEAQALTLAQRIWYLNRAAAFGYDLVLAYSEAKRPLPSQISWPAVRRAYLCLETPSEARRTDPVCQRVLAFGDPTNARAQALLKGYLCSGLSYQEIALRLGKTEEFACLYANLFCDFPERRDSDDFVQGVLDPQSERDSFQTTIARLMTIPDPSLRLMNIGHWHGPEMVVMAHGRAYAPENVTNESDLLRAVQGRLLTHAHFRAILENLGMKDPEFLLVQQLSKQPMQKTTSQSPITPIKELVHSDGMLLTLEGVVQDQMQQQSRDDCASTPAPSSNTFEI